MPRPHLLGVTTIRRRYTTLNGLLRYHWTGERVASGKPTVFGHRWEDVLHQVNGETHDFEGFGVPVWIRSAVGEWFLAWPCHGCNRLTREPADHGCER